jgi:hypothetical protein
MPNIVFELITIKIIKFTKIGIDSLKSLTSSFGRTFFKIRNIE